jgi:hypothetical protein
MSFAARALFGAALCSTVMGLGITGASAGEVTGNGRSLSISGDPEVTVLHGRSLCAFSGQNDEPESLTEGGRVQSYGQIVRSGGKAFAPSPSIGCNPNRAHLLGPE